MELPEEKLQVCNLPAEGALEDAPVRFSAQTISAEIVRRREAGAFTLANATNTELLMFDAMLSLRGLLSGLEATSEAMSKVMSGGGGLGALLKMAR